MRKSWITAFGGLAIAALCTHSNPTLAADHLDGAAVKTDASTDINDVYAWTSSDATKMYFAMTVFPQAMAMSKFSNAAKYVFHVNSSAGYGMPQTETLIICTFDADQKISCWVASGGMTLDYLTGDASATAGLASDSGKTKVFAGLRDDPFFFNLDGFKGVAETVSVAKAGLAAGADPAGCPALDMGTSDLLVTKLKTSPAGGAPQNFFATLNALAIVVSVDTTLVNDGGALLGVWASTNQ